MAVYFFDSSALVKRYAQESGTTWIIQTADPMAAHLLYIARITAVEVISALTRRQRGGSVSQGDATRVIQEFRYDLSHQYRVVEITAAVITQAMALAQMHALRGYDAVQLAAALVVHHMRSTLELSPMVLVSADRDLNTAATAEGLSVTNPNED